MAFKIQYRDLSMKHLNPFADERLLEYCIHCGASSVETRDHCPSRILLDDPFSENLPVLPSCALCNRGFSLDEEYFACLIECARTSSIEAVERPKVRRILEHSPALRARLRQSRIVGDNGDISFAVEEARIRNIVLKLARGHAAYELSEPQYGEPSHVLFEPLDLLAETARLHFETPPKISLFPEVGSRAMQRVHVAENVISWPGWVDVQPGQYRYMAAAEGWVMIRFIVSEYLACEVIWDGDNRDDLPE